MKVGSVGRGERRFGNSTDKLESIKMKVVESNASAIVTLASNRKAPGARRKETTGRGALTNISSNI